MSFLKNQNICCNINIITIAVSEYEEIIALTSKQFNEEIDLLYKDIISKMTSLRVERDEKLVVAWRNLITSVKPYLADDDLSLPAEPGAAPKGYPAPVDSKKQPHS